MFDMPGLVARTFVGFFAVVALASCGGDGDAGSSADGGDAPDGRVPGDNPFARMQPR